MDKYLIFTIKLHTSLVPLTLYIVEFLNSEETHNL